MTPTLRIYACTIAGLFWLAALVAKHFWQDIDIAMFTVTCAGVIGALGIHGMTTGQDMTPTGKAQGGFMHPMLLTGMALFLVGCAGLNAQGVLTVTYNTPQTITSTTLTPGIATLPVALMAAPPASAASSPASVPAK